MTSASYDLVTRNARLIDGTGSPSRAGDLAIYGDCIAEAGIVSGAGRRASVIEELACGFRCQPGALN